MGNYRDKLDIIADILGVASQNARKTQIMYQANLSFKILEKYLSEVISAHLVSFENEAQRYALTAKGQKFLVCYKEYSRRNKSIQKQLSNVESQRRMLDDLCWGDCLKSEVKE